MLVTYRLFAAITLLMLLQWVLPASAIVSAAGEQQRKTADGSEGKAAREQHKDDLLDASNAVGSDKSTAKEAVGGSASRKPMPEIPTLLLLGAVLAVLATAVRRTVVLRPGRVR
jgi:hypothetical protein